VEMKVDFFYLQVRLQQFKGDTEISSVDICSYKDLILQPEQTGEIQTGLALFDTVISLHSDQTVRIEQKQRNGSHFI